VSFAQSLTATATASAAIVGGLDIQKKVDMNFGTIMGTAAGTVALAPSGVRTPTTGLTLPGGVSAAASFEVTGAKGTSYNITIPTVAISTTTNPTGATPMTIDGFTSLPVAGTGTGTLDLVTGKQTISVGATLHVGANQTVGQYKTDPFTVTVNYN
jgi:hypothetical protein